MTGNDLINPDTIKIFNALDNKARFVGGCVRDFVIGKEINDIDIATELAPQDTIIKLKEVGIKTIPTGIKHGTVTAILNGKPYEITTLRKDVSCDGRHAQVEFTDSWEEDAARRDFTINAMSMGIQGKLYDYFNGQDDIKNGIVRFVGEADKRVSEDVLRILRFFRFYAYYGTGKLDESSLKACSKMANKIPELSGERIQTEMMKLLGAKEPYMIINVMNENKINEFLFENKLNIEGLEVIQKVSSEPLMRLACLLSWFSIEELKKQANRWKLSNKDKNFLLSVILPKENISNNDNILLQRRNIRFLGKDIYKSVILIEFATGQLNENLMKEFIQVADSWDVPSFPVNGNDIKNIGIHDGKQIGKVLEEAENWWEEKEYKPERGEILDYISKNLR